MASDGGTKRPLSFYVNILVAVVSGLIALVILTGGIDLKVGPLRLQVQDLQRPALVLLALLVLRRAILAAKKGRPRLSRFAFPAGRRSLSLAK